MNITAWTTWASAVDRMGAEIPKDEIWSELNKRAQVGWLPTDSNDPVLRAAFDAAWPAS
jgi:hypothetical protein